MARASIVRVSDFIRILNFRNLGTCPKCIRIAFLVMVFSWLVVAIALSLHSKATASVWIAVLASGFTILWLAHVATWAMRSHRLSHPADPSRRLAMGALGRAVLGAAIMSSTAIFPRQAQAYSGCGGWAGNSGCISVGHCFRQDSDCRPIGPCRSCGDDCGDEVC